jgi:hypothetical protein
LIGAIVSLRIVGAPINAGARAWPLGYHQTGPSLIPLRHITKGQIAIMRSFYTSQKFRSWLRTLSPRDELIARMALRDAIRDPGAGRKWEARIAALQADLIKSEADWADLVPAVQQAKQEITGNRSGSAAAAPAP